MNVAQQFQPLADAWARHCHNARFSSQLRDYLDHPAYRQLIALGPAAIPYIMERYKFDNLPWGFVLREITGIPVIADPDDFSPTDVKHTWLRWWQEQHHPAGPGEPFPPVAAPRSGPAPAAS